MVGLTFNDSCDTSSAHALLTRNRDINAISGQDLCNRLLWQDEKSLTRACDAHFEAMPPLFLRRWRRSEMLKVNVIVRPVVALRAFNN